QQNRRRRKPFSHRGVQPALLVPRVLVVDEPRKADGHGSLHRGGHAAKRNPTTVRCVPSQVAGPVLSGRIGTVTLAASERVALRGRARDDDPGKGTDQARTTRATGDRVALARTRAADPG